MEFLSLIEPDFPQKGFSDYYVYKELPICIKRWDDHDEESDFIINIFKNWRIPFFVVNPGYKKEPYKFYDVKYNLWYIIDYEHYKIRNDYVLVRVVDGENNNLGYRWKYIKHHDFRRLYEYPTVPLTLELLLSMYHRISKCKLSGILLRDINQRSNNSIVPNDKYINNIYNDSIYYSHYNVLYPLKIKLDLRSNSIQTYQDIMFKLSAVVEIIIEIIE